MIPITTMTLPALSLSLLSSILLLVSSPLVQGGQLFQGNSIVILPSKESHYPRDATITASNFYSFVTEDGYLSFGWWLGTSASTPTNHTRCTPHPTPNSYDWFEYSTAGSCNTSTSTCRVHAVNYSPTSPSAPTFDVDYVSRLIDVGNGSMGDLAVSYFDEEFGAYAVGTRRILSGGDGGEEDYEAVEDECNEAFDTLRAIYRRMRLNLKLKLENPCGRKGGDRNSREQFPLQF